jgi:hypothetical protein
VEKRRLAGGGDRIGLVRAHADPAGVRGGPPRAGAWIPLKSLLPLDGQTYV